MLLPMLAELSGSIHIGLAALGAAIGVGLIGMAATPILVQAILAIAFAEAIVFYALYLAPK
jgi:F-type H+-transporting ATPase subunit c